MKQSISYEFWKSSDKQREIHCFISGTDKYVFGYNPHLIPEAAVKKFLQEQGFEITGKRVRKTTTSNTPKDATVVR